MNDRSWNLLLAVSCLSLSGCSTTIGFVPIDNIKINPVFDYRTTELKLFSSDSGKVILIRKAFEPESCAWKAFLSSDSSFQDVWIKVFGMNFYQSHKSEIDAGKRIEFVCKNSEILEAELMAYVDCDDKTDSYNCYSHTWTGVAIDRHSNAYKVAFKK